MPKFKHHLLLLLVLISSLGFSQDISVSQNFWGYEFKQGDQELSWSELLEETEVYPESYDLIKRAQSQNTLSSIFGFAGGALVGIPIGQTISSADPNWVLAIVGGALITVAVPLTSSSKRNLEDGVSRYNSSTKTSLRKEIQPEVSLIGNANGLGITLRF
ncbi:hypothetical protein [Psychroflexus montanilacus]|uniref:hypothetical protein n=1 Tax=Psychroflexus montanilacus TaxID=2873598 RepID=UPI001CD00BCE|nr:hypothetical protein [Psychroflexus montanilacus]MBZ9652243.1 hypothetical protein [Psychroflexus montanilacus]